MRVVCVLSFLFILSLTPAHGQSDTFVNTIKSLKKSVVPILCIQPDITGQTRMFIDGTGFFINEKGYFLTAAHVIADLGKGMKDPLGIIEPCKMAIYVPKEGWQRDAISFDIRWFQFANCVTDPDLDVAACKPIDALPMKIEPIILNTGRPPDGTPVAFTGFPLSFVQPLSARGYIAAYRNPNPADRLGSRELIIDRQNWPGSSGSPVYVADGSVIGIVLQRGIGDSEGIAIARPSPIIISFLSSNSISAETQAPKKNHKKRK